MSQTLPPHFREWGSLTPSVSGAERWPQRLGHAGSQPGSGPTSLLALSLGPGHTGCSERQVLLLSAVRPSEAPLPYVTEKVPFLVLMPYY